MYGKQQKQKLLSHFKNKPEESLYLQKVSACHIRTKLIMKYFIQISLILILQSACLYSQKDEGKFERLYE